MIMMLRMTRKITIKVKYKRHMRSSSYFGSWKKLEAARRACGGLTLQIWTNFSCGPMQQLETTRK